MNYGKSVNAVRQNVSTHTFEEDEISLAKMLDEIRSEPIAVKVTYKVPNERN